MADQTAVRVDPRRRPRRRPADSRRRPTLAAGARRPAAGHRAPDHQAVAAGPALVRATTGWGSRGDFTHRAYAAIFRTMQQVRATDGADGDRTDGVRAEWIHHVAIVGAPPDALPAGRRRWRWSPSRYAGPRRSRTPRPRSAKLRLLTAMRQVERAEVQAAADESGGAPDLVQPDVLRAGGAGSPQGEPALRRPGGSASPTDRRRNQNLASSVDNPDRQACRPAGAPQTVGPWTPQHPWPARC